MNQCLGINCLYSTDIILSMNKNSSFSFVYCCLAIKYDAKGKKTMNKNYNYNISTFISPEARLYDPSGRAL